MAPERYPCLRAVTATVLPAARELGIGLDQTQLTLLADFCRLLLEANRHLNLTAIADPESVARRHFVDSLTISRALPTELRTGRISLVDVGTGGGLPGIPLAIAFPSWRMTLIDATVKKVRFLVSAIQSLGLRNATATCMRAEEAAIDGRDSFDVAIARAVAPARVLVEYLAPLVRSEGQIVLYKSGDIHAEMVQAETAMARLQCRLRSIVPVPESLHLGGDRFLVVIDKVAPTPPEFPRRVGRARARPF